ncbi:MAG: hypothetical protein QM760_21940 [Nibricoccus sp.]
MKAMERKPFALANTTHRQESFSMAFLENPTKSTTRCSVTCGDGYELEILEVEMKPRRIALKVDCDTFEGTKNGLPNLLRLFDELKIRATFLFTLGPDTSGR